MSTPTPPKPEKHVYYPLGDQLRADEAEYFNVPRDSVQILALFTGQIRPPLANERYLQPLAGKLKAYRALEALSTPYPIVRLVRVRRKVVLEFIKAMPADHLVPKEDPE